MKKTESIVYFKPSYDVSPFDDEYPVYLLSSNLQRTMGLADVAIDKVFKTVSKESLLAAQAVKSLHKDFRYVLDISDETKKQIAKGNIKLTVESGGKTYAQFKNGNKYGKKIPVKKEDFGQGLDPVQMANAMQMRAIQSQIEEMSDQIQLIDCSAREILQGQQNDRIALYYSGLSLFLEAQNISDETLKKQLLAQSLKSLSEATFQLNLTLKSDIEYMQKKSFEKGKRKMMELLDERIDNINQSFKYIHQATLLRAGIYCQQGEMTAMGSVLKEYSDFIEQRIAGNANMLSEYDVHDIGATDKGWKARAAFKLDISDINNLLTYEEKVIYLSSGGEIDD